MPLLLAAAVYGVMWIGIAARARCTTRDGDLHADRPFLAKLESGAIPRVPGSAVFFTRAAKGAPPVLSGISSITARCTNVLILRLMLHSTPRVKRGALHAHPAQILARRRALRLHGNARHSSGSEPDVRIGCDVDLADVTFYVGHET